jgi:hypothetical protein
VTILCGQSFYWYFGYVLSSWLKQPSSSGKRRGKKCCGGLALLVLNFGSKWMCVSIFVSRPIYLHTNFCFTCSIREWVTLCRTYSAPWRESNRTSTVVVSVARSLCVSEDRAQLCIICCSVGYLTGNILRFYRLGTVAWRKSRTLFHSSRADTCAICSAPTVNRTSQNWLNFTLIYMFRLC